MAGSRNSKSVVCKICNATISRSGDLPRHMKTHSENKEELTFHCPWQGCRYQSLQKSNVQTHIRTHTGVKDKKCPDCSFTTRDPGSLTRHRKRKHEYIPKRIGNRRKREGSSNGSDDDGNTNNSSPVTGEGPSREPSSGKVPSARPSRLDITSSPYARWQPSPSWPQESLSQPSASSSSQPNDTAFSPPSSTYTLQPARNWSAESNTPYSRRQPTPPWNASAPESERNQPVWPRDSLLLPEMRGAVPEPPWARQSPPRRRSPPMLLPDPNNIDPSLDEDEDEDGPWRSPGDWSRNPDPNWERRRASGGVRSPILPDPNQDEMDGDWRRPSPFLPEGEISLPYDNGHHRPTSQRWSPSRRREEDRPHSPSVLGTSTSNAVLDPALRPPSPIPPRIQTARALQRQATEKSTWDPALRPPSPIPPKTQSTRLPAQYRDIEVEQAQEQERRRRAREHEDANYQSIVHPEPIPPRRRYLDDYAPGNPDPGPQPIPPRTRLPRRFYDNDNDTMPPMSAHPSNPHNPQTQPQTRFIHHSTEERRYDPNFTGSPIPPRSQTIKIAGDEEAQYTSHRRPAFKDDDEGEDSPMTSADEDEDEEQRRIDAEKLSRQRQREMTLLATASRGRSKSFVASPQDVRPQVNLNGQVASGSGQAPMGSLIRKWSGPTH